MLDGPVADAVLKRAAPQQDLAQTSPVSCSELHSTSIARTRWMTHGSGHRDAVRLVLEVVEKHSHSSVGARGVGADHLVIRRGDCAAFVDH